MGKLSVKKACCWICFSSGCNNTTLTAVNSEKILKNCDTYLETSIIIKSFNNETPVTCCNYCYESANQLRLLEEQVTKLQKEISDLSFLFSKNVLERRSRFKNETNKSAETSNGTTNKLLLINKNSGGHYIAVIENVRAKVKKEVFESTDLPSDSQGGNERDDLVTDMTLDEDENETIHNDKCEKVSHSRDATDIKYSYDETVPKVVDTLNKPVVQHYQRLPSTKLKAHLDQHAKTASVEELLESSEMPVIQIKRIQPCGSRYSTNIVFGDIKQGMKFEKDLHDFSRPKTSSGELSQVERLKSRKIPCSKSFQSVAGLETQKEIHLEEKPFKCDLCSKSFNCPSNLNKHKKLHSEEKPHKCSVCGKSFRQSHKLKEHERNHSGEKPYNCSLCSKSFKTSCKLKAHQAVHLKERPYKCSFCERAFKSTKNLRQHEKLHSGNKPYKCTLCEKSFLQLAFLKIHEMVHKGEKPFNCSFCSTSFTTLGLLNRHEKIHSEERERPYKCSLCPKSFYQSSDAKLHERIHTGERDYQCSICEKTFMYGRSLKRHREREHGETNEEFILP